MEQPTGSDGVPPIYRQLQNLDVEPVEWAITVSKLSDLDAERAEEVACVMHTHYKLERLKYSTKHPYKATKAKGGIYRYPQDAIPEALRVLLGKYIAYVTAK